MANIKGLADFGRKDSDTDDDEHNEYYAGGEKRWGRPSVKTLQIA